MPFDGDLTSTANGTLLLSIVAAILYGFMQSGSPSWRRSVAKTAAVGLLAVLSFALGGPVLLTAALVLSALGDAALSRDGEPAFMAGLAAFLAAHLLYVALFTIHWPGTDLLAEASWRPVAGIVLIAFCGFMLRRLMPAVGTALRGPVAAYVAAITLMGLAALGVPGWGVAAGAALFIASDAILATERFLLPPASPHRSWAGPAVWVLYYAGQLLFALAFLL